MVAMAWQNMKQRRLRTSLTTLGVVIGITAIIGLAALGEGFRMDIRQRMQSGFELDSITIIPGSLFAGYSREGFSDNDIANISQIQGVRTVTGIMQFGNVTLYDGNQTSQAFVGTGADFEKFPKVFPDRFVFDSGSTEGYTNDTVILGYKANHPNENDTRPFAVAGDNITVTVAIPQTYSLIPRYENRTFIVGGTLQQKGTPGITNFDYWIFIPLNVARDIYDKPERSDLIFVKVYDPEQADAVGKSIEALFPPFKITILVPSTFIKQVDSILNIIQVFLMAIASISLLVAGIGIMNIMTVSVMERTREIGIFKAIGATSRTVLAMFLTEALLVGLIGGVIGIFAGYGLSYGLAYVLSKIMTQSQESGILQGPTTQAIAISPIFAPEWTAGAFVFAVVVCIIFGLYPARKASRLNPVEALRYE